MNVHQEIAARKPLIEKVYEQAKSMTLSEFLHRIGTIIGGLSLTQTQVYSRIYTRERSNER